MNFKMKYQIQTKYLTKQSKRRCGKLMPKVLFIVAHDTGNPGSSALANIRYYEMTKNNDSASAHTFIDDCNIIECIPATTGLPEIAYHVRYNVDTDNKLFGDDANDTAIGVELCFGEKWKNGKLVNKINDKEAYKRYVWYLAYLCHKFKLNPEKDIVGHYQLDPQRRTDPENGLRKMGKSFNQLIKDVAYEYNECSTSPVKDTFSRYFKDIDSKIVAEAVDYLFERKITLGDGKGNYKPDLFITREEMALFLYRVMKYFENKIGGNK